MTQDRPAAERLVDIDHTICGYDQVFGATPTIIAHAPGRVNLIGEHVDYNDGLVLPFAISQRVVVAAAGDDSGFLTAHSVDLAEAVSVAVDTSAPVATPSWENYLRGMVFGLRQAGVSPGGAKLWIGGDLPAGSGLSSSAALCLAIGGALAKLGGVELAPTKLASIARAAEHDYAGTPCGIMDQYASCFGRRSKALLLDCRDLSFSELSFDPEELALLVIPSGVEHALAQGAYEQRVRTCREAVGIIAAEHAAVGSLRDVSAEMLESCQERLGPTCFRRARHVVTEMARVRAAAETINAKDWPRLGALLGETQDSLRDDYEVSCPQIDELITILRDCSGVLGARMVGGGFGGMILALVADVAVAAVEEELRQRYYVPRNLVERPFRVRPSDGAGALALA
ncbi:MAG: galactokinase [bacterium]|nr:galactokinase [bacterium]